MTALSITLGLLLLTALWVLRDQQQRHETHTQSLLVTAEDERVNLELSHHQQTTTLVEALSRPSPDLTELIGLVDRLCQRLQAPEVAVVDHSQALPLPPMPEAVMPDDDEGWHEAHGPSKEQLADLLAEAEIRA